jgi:hypothetical protein
MRRIGRYRDARIAGRLEADGDTAGEYTRGFVTAGWVAALGAFDPGLGKK